LTIGTEQIRNN